MVDGLGYAGAVHFIRMIENGSSGMGGNYTEEREKLLEGQTIDDIVAQVEEMNKKAEG